jgi:aminoglycoside phosphotransferase (APT) family kinase protein
MSSGARFILRKKPPGTSISPVAHQVDREHRVIRALGSIEGFPVPRVFDLCTDSSVIGTPFYVSLPKPMVYAVLRMLIQSI